MSTQKRFTPAANGRDNKKDMWQLTQKQWLVYYWILAHSFWNPQENHYYIYKDRMKSGEIQRGVGVTAPTVRAAIEKLQTVGALSVHPYIETAYILNRPTIYTSLDTDILKFLLSFHEFFGSDLVTLYAILRRLWVLEGTVHFNLSQFAIVMGMLKQNVSKQQLYLMLILYKSAGLAKIDKKTHNNTLGQEVTTFYVSEVKDIATPTIRNLFNSESQEIDIEQAKIIYNKLLQ